MTPCYFFGEYSYMRFFLAPSVGAGTVAAGLLLTGLPPASADATNLSDTPADAPHAAEAKRTPGANHTLPLKKLSTKRDDGTALQTRGVQRQRVQPFSMIGVTWKNPAKELDQTVRLRVRDAQSGTWSSWKELSESHLDDGPDAPERDATRGGTSPLWVGASNGIEVTLVPDATKATDQKLSFPDGIRVDLIDPGNSPNDSKLAEQAPSVAASPSSTPSDPQQEEPSKEPSKEPDKASGHSASKPDIISRKKWGADESIREQGFGYTSTVKAAFVHHTATGNSYSCSKAPAVIRSMYRYHVKSNGWRDIGYNFLVDKCGRIYEGRAGGVSKPVLGAHTLGYNTDTTGVAVIGNYESTTPNKKILKSVAHLSAWKLGLTGRNAAGKVKLTSSDSGSRYPKGTTRTFHAISGHRDGFKTECPGAKLYAKLGTIRSLAGSYQDG